MSDEGKKNVTKIEADNKLASLNEAFLDYYKDEEVIQSLISKKNKSGDNPFYKRISSDSKKICPPDGQGKTRSILSTSWLRKYFDESSQDKRVFKKTQIDDLNRLIKFYKTNVYSELDKQNDTEETKFWPYVVGLIVSFIPLIIIPFAVFVIYDLVGKDEKGRFHKVKIGSLFLMIAISLISLILTYNYARGFLKSNYQSISKTEFSLNPVPNRDGFVYSAMARGDNKTLKMPKVSLGNSYNFFVTCSYMGTGKGLFVSNGRANVFYDKKGLSENSTNIVFSLSGKDVRSVYDGIKLDNLPPHWELEIVSVKHTNNSKHKTCEGYSFNYDVDVDKFESNGIFLGEVDSYSPVIDGEKIFCDLGHINVEFKFTNKTEVVLFEND